MKRIALAVAMTSLLSACQSLPQRSTGSSEQSTAQTPDQTNKTPINAATKNETARSSSVAQPTPQPSPPRDLIEKITREFTLLPQQDWDFSTYIRFYERYPKHLQRVLTRAKPFLPMIYAEIKKRNMPTEIALLPAVESAFNPKAHSWQGASGLWQFTASTARIEGLKMNWWYDARRDPYVSTQAALDYLEKLHGMTGDWLLALAAYNGGIGTVLNAMKRVRKRLGREEVTFWDIRKDLPRETQKYVPQLMAICTLLKTPERIKTDLPAIPLQPEHRLLTFEQQIDLDTARKLSNLDNKTFHHLNAGYKRTATPPDGPHQLLLPKPSAERILAAVQKKPTLLAVKLRHHRIRPGESLILLAKRYGTTVKTLKRLNNLKGNTLIAGRTLIVPNTPVKATRLAKTKSSRSTGHQVIVQRGETLWDIAMRYGMKVSTLAQVNGLSVHKPLRPGQTLRIPARYAKARIVHKVKPGESLWLVARRYNTSTRQLKRWNDLKKNMLKPGQELVIWLDRRNNLASNG